MNNLYDALEICLQGIENGADIETVLLRYPDLADELRPILETSATAKDLSVPAPSIDVVRRNRAKLFQRAAEMRESKITPVAVFNEFAPLRRVASALVILALVLASGTSLVGAASTSLPGDHLYSVKRSWENAQLFFTFDAQTREALEVEHENERLDELRELFTSGRSAEVSFSGLVARQNGTEWLVAGISVVISPQTDLPGQPVQTDSAVRVVGITQADGSVLAESIELLASDASLPEVEENNAEGSNLQNENESVSGSENEAPKVAVTQTPESESNEKTFNGFLDILNGGFWTINGVPADVSNAEVIGTPAVGSAVKVEGYFNSEGRFIVTKIEFLGDNSNGNDNVNNNDNNSNEDNSNNDNSNEDDGGGKSGKGGGGGD